MVGNIPNTIVSDIQVYGNTLVAGTFGRGIWDLSDVSTTIATPGVLQINGDTDFAGEDDTIRLVIDAANPAQLDVFLDGVLTPVQLSAVQQINVNGLGGNDRLIVDSSNGLINIVNGIRYDGGTGIADDLQLVQTPLLPQWSSETYSVGLTDGSGTISINGGGTAGTQTVFFDNLSPVLDTVPVATLTVNATAADNAISYSQGSGSDGLVTIDEHESLEFNNKGNLIINAGAGHDNISINNGVTALTSLAVDGGDPADGDTLSITGTGAAVSVNTLTSTITGAIGGVVPLTYSNIEGMGLLAGIGALTVTTTAADDLATVTPGLTTASNSGSVTSNGAVPQITFTNSGNVTLNLGGGTDAVVVNGSAVADTIAVSGAAVGIGGRNSVSFTGVEGLTVNGNAGSDTFNVTPSSVSTFVDGGDPVGALPGDLLNIIAGGGAVTFNAGPQIDEGSFVVGANQPVSFDHIESFGITGSGPATINGTNGPDAITVIARDETYNAAADGIQDFTVSVNTGPNLLFLNVGSLAINALSGSDQVTVRAPAPNNKVWDVDVTIDGGPPAGDTDRVIIETPGAAAETVVYTPTGFDSATMDLASLSSLVTITTTEAVIYDGQGDGDSLTVNGTSGNDTIVYTPGANDQAGSFAVNNLLGLSYQNLGAAGNLTVAAGDGTNDILVYNGTAANDTFTVDGGGGIGGAGQVRLNTRLPVNTSGVETLTLEGLAGDDLFTLVPSISTSVFQTLNFNGGAQASSTGDRVNLVGTSGNDAFAISGQSVSLGGRTVQSSGVEDIRLNALGGADEITYNALSNVTENITISASSIAGSGQLNVQGVALYDFQGVESFAVNGNAGPNGADTLSFAGTTANDLIQIHMAATATAADPILQLQDSTGINTLLTLRSYTGFNTLNVLGLDGEDTFNVYVAGTNTLGTAPSRNLFIDGGTPTGKKKSTDNLNLIYTSPRPSIIQSAATQNPQSGLIDVKYGAAARFLVQYADIEQVVIRKA
jgi:hypothetical protein